MRQSKRALLNLALVAALTMIVSGGAANSAGASDLSFSQLDVGQYAVDGSDFYWMRSHGRNRFGCPTKTQILRRDLLGGSTRVVASYSTNCEVELESLAAGGGRVAVGRFTDKPFDGWDSKIFSMNRDGSEKRVLATGSIRGESILDRPTAACGRSVQLMTGSPSGAFVVAQFTQTSKIKRCGGARNATTALYESVSSDGSRRKIYSKTDKIPMASGRRPIADVITNGDFAALVKSETRRVVRVNLATGTVSGPLRDSVSKSGQKISSIGVSVGPNGEVLINAPEPRPKNPQAYLATDLFKNPADPAAVIRKERDGPVWFCGSRLVASTQLSLDDEFDSLVSLDPTTLDVENVISRVEPGSDIEGCSGAAVTLSSETVGGKIKVHAVALTG